MKFETYVEVLEKSEMSARVHGRWWERTFFSGDTAGDGGSGVSPVRPAVIAADRKPSISDNQKDGLMDLNPTTKSTTPPAFIIFQRGNSRVTLQLIVVNIWLFNSILYCFQVIKTFRVITVKHQPFIKLWYYPAPYKVSWTPLPPCLSVCLKSAPLHFIPWSSASSFFKTEWFASLLPLCCSV